MLAYTASSVHPSSSSSSLPATTLERDFPSGNLSADDDVFRYHERWADLAAPAHRERAPQMMGDNM